MRSTALSSPAGAALAFALALAAPAAAQPVFEPLPDVALLAGSPLQLPLVAGPAEGVSVAFSAESSDPLLVTASISEGNRSLRIAVAGRGEMLFHLFEQLAPRATTRIGGLAEAGFYDGLTFHRVVDGFVIQGGDPRGDGTGGSGVLFDDQFHVDLQHNRRGLLSMAKRDDDTNDSQFFVTEGSSRDLDFNHTIFGLLTRGEAVREAISGVATGANGRPTTPVVMETVRVVSDGGAAVLMLKAPEGASGSASVTVTATDAAGAVAVATFQVSVSPDPVNSPPFLADIPPLVGRVNTALSFQLEAIDVEGDAAFYLDQDTLNRNGLTIPVVAPADLVYQVDFDTGVVSVTPRNGLSGTFSISVATGVMVDRVDYQVVPITLQP